MPAESDTAHQDVAAALDAVVAAIGGDPRPGQLEMSLAVADTLGGGAHLLVQAGTGTGKTIGYLVPAILAGRTVVVATATKALQDQLAGKDLPFLAEHLDTPFAFAVLIFNGRGRARRRARPRRTRATVGR